MPAPILAENGKISAPTSPTASGWTFEGWYLDTACESAWTEEHKFTADATLYAKWTKNPVAVTITFAGGEDAVLNTGASGEHEGMSGDKITLPACMYTKPGYIFRSWDGTFAGTEYTLPDEAKTNGRRSQARLSRTILTTRLTASAPKTRRTTSRSCLPRATRLPPERRQRRTQR